MKASNKQLKWMAWAESGAQVFATCSRRQYMALVLSPSGRLIGMGYNGSAPALPNCVDGGCPRAQTTVAHGTTYDNCTAVHAEENALMWSDRFAREGGTLIINGPPCWGCAKLIAGSGIKTLVYKHDPEYFDAWKGQALMKQAGIELVKVDS